MRFLDGEASLHVGEASWFVVAGVEDEFSELDVDAFWRSQLYVTGNHSQYQLPESDVFQHQRHNTKLARDLLRSRELSIMTFLVRGRTEIAAALLKMAERTASPKMMQHSQD